ncbi:LLM class flavin-dependent oxidoreductase [Dactylosporangium sp. AC04546]|uniref:LLM class flavin-dependent oxidoreductase n=1 Tax=Dactylosporangium sp. AC04546 TaxID=2862460 RepID=UPI001EDF13CF|nr:LLM class flavin-dependent oxidoreductase [Dactylosporangium sp. AC04546]WVK81405.1 LLM class flavin-dependent oxidoreductase [Dactylosporangium sp. AC04546]
MAEFGISITPDDPASALALARAADAAGLDLIGIQDHAYNPGFLDTMTLIAHLGALTERVRFVPDVADLALRPAAMLAKAAATLDVLTGGRFDLGVGAGAFPDAIAGMGGPPWRGAAAVAATAESLQVLRAALDARGPVALNGEHLRLAGYRPGPSPTRRVPVWVGAQGPRLLGVVGELADGWVSPLNIYVPPADVPSKQSAIDEAAQRAGRDPSSVRRMYNVLGTIDGASRHGLSDSAATWARMLADWSAGLRFDTFIFWPVHDELDQVRRFAEDVVPRVRELLA